MKTVNIIVIDCYMTIVDELFWLAGQVIGLLRMVAIWLDWFYQSQRSLAGVHHHKTLAVEPWSAFKM